MSTNPSNNKPKVKSVFPSVNVETVEPTPTPTPSQSDSSYIEIASIMPSKMAFYHNEELAIRPLNGFEVQKMVRSVQENTFIHQFDAIVSTLNPILNNLTMGDFQFLMYWLRLNSYKKHPVELNWTCRNPEHVLRAENWLRNEDGEKLTDVEKETSIHPDTLDNKTSVNSTQLETNLLDVEKCNAFMEEFFKNYGLYIWAPMAKDLIEGFEDAEVQKDPNNPDAPDGVTLDWWNKYAGMLYADAHGATLAERRQVVQEASLKFSADFIADMNEWEVLCEHGVKQKVEVFCKECGKTESQTLYVDPHSFRV